MSRPAHTPMLPCSRCGYDLAGLDTGTRCPECDLDAAKARQLMPLAALSPRALKLVAWCVALIGAAWVFTGLWYINFAVEGHTTRLSWWTVNTFDFIRTWLPGLVAALAASVAWQIRNVPFVSGHVITRILWCALALYAASVMIEWYINGRPWPRLFGAYRHNGLYIHLALIALPPLCTLAIALYLRAIALEGRHRRWGWLSMIGAVLLVCGGLRVCVGYIIELKYARAALYTPAMLDWADMLLSWASAPAMLLLGIPVLVFANHIFRRILPVSTRLHRTTPPAP
ncbi:MAG: hypothetical protein KF838_12225 [Phycisphaeraceae bacterium]|nr:MAG: hypothetical protein KF838_12225 [Phycisphaeraceae bacterium]